MMRNLILILLFALVACAKSAPDDVEREETNGDSVTEVESTDGDFAQRGDTCQSGEQSGESIDRECAAGLDCCYPCGVQGCDHVCATPDDCQSWLTLP